MRFDENSELFANTTRICNVTSRNRSQEMRTKILVLSVDVQYEEKFLIRISDSSMISTYVI
jgi:hypothetical protein